MGFVVLDAGRVDRAAVALGAASFFAGAGLVFLAAALREEWIDYSLDT